MVPVSAIWRGSSENNLSELDRREMVHKWREERLSRMVDRMIRRRSHSAPVRISSAILGQMKSKLVTPVKPVNTVQHPRDKKQVMKIRETKLSNQRKLLANPLLDSGAQKILQAAENRDVIAKELPIAMIKPTRSVLQNKSAYHASKDNMLACNQRKVRPTSAYDLNNKRAVWNQHQITKRSVSVSDKLKPVVKVLNEKKSENFVRESVPVQCSLRIKDQVKKQFVRVDGPKPEIKMFNKTKSDIVSLRCSLSTQHRIKPVAAKKGCLVSTSNKMTTVKPMLPRSLPEKNIEAAVGLSSPIAEESTSELNRTFTPSPIDTEKRWAATSRPSVSRGGVSFYTPVSCQAGNTQLPDTITLQEKLNAWLEKRGKVLGSFKHLRCFCSQAENKLQKTLKVRPLEQNGQTKIRMSKVTPTAAIKSSTVQEKENMLLIGYNRRDTISLDTSSIHNKNIHWDTNFDNRLNAISIDTPGVHNNYEHWDSCIAKNHIQTEDEVINPEVVDEKAETSKGEARITEAALNDLYSLITMGYPPDECTSWLAAIVARDPEVVNFAFYWECAAALDNMQGNFDLAVDCYQRAIIRGAEPQHIESRLDELLDNMKNLQLALPAQNNKMKGVGCARDVDARNIFKSSVIHFALQQKAIKKLSREIDVSKASLQYIATPVRHSNRESTRQSTTKAWKGKYVSSLHQLSPDFKNATEFKPNFLLFPK